MKKMKLPKDKKKKTYKCFGQKHIKRPVEWFVLEDAACVMSSSDKVPPGSLLYPMVEKARRLIEYFDDSKPITKKECKVDGCSKKATYCMVNIDDIDDQHWFCDACKYSPYHDEELGISKSGIPLYARIDNYEDAARHGMRYCQKKSNILVKALAEAKGLPVSDNKQVTEKQATEFFKLSEKGISAMKLGEADKSTEKLLKKGAEWIAKAKLDPDEHCKEQGGRMGIHKDSCKTKVAGALPNGFVTLEITLYREEDDDFYALTGIPKPD